MSGQFVTDAGFQKKTLAEIKAEYEAAFQAIFGNDIDLDARGPFGQIIGILSNRDANLWDGAEEIYTARDPGEATGVSLDNISEETSVRRLDATATGVVNVQLFGDEGTVVAAGKQARQDGETLTYSLDSAVTITKAAARHVQLEPNTAFPTAGTEVYTVTIDGTPYTHNAGVGETKAQVINAVKALIDAGSWLGTATNISDTYLKLEYVSTDFSVLWTGTFDLFLLASGGDFTADETGPNTLPANTLTVIVTPVTNWDSVNNPSAGTTGRNTETDDALRIRRKNTLITGSATEEAIRNALLNEVTGVQTVSVTSNRTMVTVSGIPPKAFEVVIEGGDDNDIAEKIWENAPGGIEISGSTSVVIQDSEGNNQTIKFSRPEAVYVWIKVKRDLNTEETYPTNGDDQIKDNIVEWALTNLNPGKDLIRQRLNTPIYDVPGIEDIEVTLDYSTNPGHSPSYSEKNVVVDVRQLANLDQSRITVEVLTP